MVPALERNESRPRDQRGEQSALLERHDAVISGVQDECRCGDPRTEQRDIDLVEHVAQAVSDLGTRGHALQLVERSELLGRPVGKEHRREHPAEFRILGPPADANEVEQDLGVR